ncbi:MAG: hypothetical protein D6768_06135 [Chloroflexi bacterium]|nr:MAG: hypothetical protein D6768_06135 [Chloroflexota bacterium]
MKQQRLQKRQHPIFSPLALISTILLACGLLGWMYVAGGQAFSPGELSAVNHSDEQLEGVSTHADFEHVCTECHTPFVGVEARLCERCHTDVAQQQQNEDGLHSRFENVKRCQDCHTEHKGSQFDQFAAALVDFDHTVTDFSLEKHMLDYQNSPIACETCHENTGRKFTMVVSACADCHQAADAEFVSVHTEAFGQDCLACHDGHDTMAGFTLEAHAETFALTGAHVDTTCEKCHAGGVFEGTEHACEACHTEPDAHAQMFGVECASCHSPEGWQPALLDGEPFDHAVSTSFSLVKHQTNYNDAAFTCRTCHAAAQPVEFANAQCVECHQPADPQFMAEHTAQFGQACMDCHNGTGEMTEFDHNQVFVLDGQHAPLECEACHANKVFKGTPKDCAGCHQEPVVHAGLFGLQCDNCHTSGGWQPAQLTRHNFPLDHGGEGEIACETCHTATYVEYTCYNCHAHDPAETEQQHLQENIGAEELLNCVECHPTGQESVK